MSISIAKLVVEMAESGIGSVVGAIGKIGAVVGVAGIAAGGLGLSIAAGNEQAQISFETMLGSAEKAGGFLKELQAFAAKTPFEFPELQRAASNLVSAGFAASDVIPIMTTLGDVTSGMGTGSEGVRRATIALQQMSAAGRITGEDLNQLRDAGIPVFDLLAGATGKSKEEIAKLAAAGKLGKAEMEAMFTALKTGGAGLERFSGLMEKQSQSLTGMVATLKDTVGQGLAAAMQGAVPIIKGALPQVTEAINGALGKLGPALGSAIAAIAPAIGPVITLFGTLVTALAPVLAIVGNLVSVLATALVPIIDQMAPILGQTALAFGQLLFALVPLLPPLAELLLAVLPILPPVVALATMLVGLLVPALVMLVGIIESVVAPTIRFLAELISEPGKAVERLGEAWDAAWEGIKNVIGSAKDWIGDRIEDLVGLVRGLPGRALDALGDVGSILFNAGKKLISGFIDGIFGMFDTVKNTLGNLASKLTSWKGPPERDAKLLFGAGELVMGGFISGLESRYMDVKNSLGGVTGMIGGSGAVAGAAGSGSPTVILQINGDEFARIVGPLVRDELLRIDPQLKRSVYGR